MSCCNDYRQVVSIEGHFCSLLPVSALFIGLLLFYEGGARVGQQLPRLRLDTCGVCSWRGLSVDGHFGG